MLEVVRISVLSDNHVWLMHADASSQSAVVAEELRRRRAAKDAA